MSNPNVTGVNQLWVPGMHLDDDYPTPTPDELADLWQGYSGRQTMATGSVFGALSTPQAPIRAIASIDLCEVLRSTAQSFDHALGRAPTDRNIYAKDTWFYPHDEHTDYGKSVVVSVVRAVMNAGLVEVKQDTVVASERMQAWRQAGIYVVANTSTLPGCEAPTIRDFSERYGLQNCFDGLLLPRNHNGTGALTKAKALKLALAEISVDASSIPIVHIDDSLQHIDGFTSEFNDHEALGLYVPSHQDNMHAPDYLLADNTAHAFELAHQFYNFHGVVK